MKNGLCGALEERSTLSTTRTGQEVSYGVNEQHLNFREQPRNTTGTLLSPAACVDRCKGAPSCMYVYLGRSLPTYRRACENVRSTYGHTDGANTDGRTVVTPETYSWSTGKPTGVGTAVKRNLFMACTVHTYVHAYPCRKPPESARVVCGRGAVTLQMSSWTFTETCTRELRELQNHLSNLCQVPYLPLDCSLNATVQLLEVQ